MDVFGGIVIAAVTAIVMVGALVIGGFVVLFRRRGDRGLSASRAAFGSSSIESLGLRASAMLVRADDAVRTADEELGFAIAQFGPDRSREFGRAVSEARQRVTEAFRVQQRLDDAYPDSDRERREWTLQVIALCEQADRLLAEQDAAFARLRRQEAGAADTLADLRSRIEAAAARRETTRGTTDALSERYAPAAYLSVADAPDRAAAALAEARAAVDAAEQHVSASGVNAVSDTLQQAAHSLREAEQLLDAVERTDRDLAAATEEVEKLRTSARADLAEAAMQRDKAPDADTGRAIIDAMAGVQVALAARPGPADPVRELDDIGAAIARLDLALASARNQSERLAHARAAYQGTLVSATSQIAAAREYITSHGGGAEARTRLAEAERQLMLAQAETEPVAALDTIRRAVTLARDADALARYSALGG